jgi:transcriptional regulator with XRE-family HTH domain
MSFGGHLRTLRGESKRSRAELAQRVGVPVSTLRNWENDRGFPGVPALLRLAGALGVPAERLPEGVDDPAAEAPDPPPEQPHPEVKGRRREDTGTVR